jgi:hypothetical protein
LWLAIAAEEKFTMIGKPEQVKVGQMLIVLFAVI